MTSVEIIHHRLKNQQIAETKFNMPQEIVNWMVALQAQEFAHAKWAIGLRLQGRVDAAEIDQAFNEGSVLRTHVMRPTWHFVAPEDIRWLLALTAPSVHAASAYMYRKLELDSKLFNRASNLIIKALEGGRSLTRARLKTWLGANRIQADGLRLGYIMMYAELEAIVCSGPREGKQFTYALLDERAPGSNTFQREETLGQFVQRYFRSRGPATLQDFSYWSGLTAKDAKEGAALLPNNFIRETINGKEYIFCPETQEMSRSKKQTSFLMPDYDEYGMSYKDRTLLRTTNKITPRLENVNEYSHWLIVDGKIEGTWRFDTKTKASITISPFVSLNKLKKQAVNKAVKQYQLFLKSR